MPNTKNKNQMPPRCEASTPRSDLQLFPDSPEVTPEFNQYLSMMLINDPNQLYTHIQNWSREVHECCVTVSLRRDLTRFLVDVVGEPSAVITALDEDQLSEKYFGISSDALIQRLHEWDTLEHLLAESLITVRKKNMGGADER
jgi:hypothetical protein